jgi:hypothetical protein
VLPVRYELNLHILFSINSVFKGLKSVINLNNKHSVPTAQKTHNFYATKYKFETLNTNTLQTFNRPHI